MPSSILLPKCFEAPPPEPGTQSPKLEYRPNPEEFLPKMAQIIFDQLGEEEQSRTTVQGIETKLKRHWTGNMYSHKGALETFRELLGNIFGLMSGQIKDDSLHYEESMIQPIALKLHEGLMNCSEGFQNRVLETWRGLQKISSFGQRVQAVREEIVAGCARNLSEDVHEQNTVAVTASGLYKTRQANPDDKYVGTIRLEEIRAALARHFDEKFHEYFILEQIESQLRGELNHMGYKGLLGTDKSYVAEEYDAFVAHLEGAFPSSGVRGASAGWCLTPGQYKAEDEVAGDNDYNIIDIDWRIVRKAVFNRLTDEGYFLPPQEMRAGYENLSPRGRFFYFEYVATPTEDTDLVVRLSAEAFREILFYAIDKKLPIEAWLMSALSTREEAFRSLVLSSTDRGGINLLALAIARSSSSYPQLFELIQKLPANEQCQIVSQVIPDDDGVGNSGDNILGVAARTSSEAVVSLLDLMSEWDNQIKYRMLCQQDKHLFSPIEHAAAQTPSAVAPLLSAISTLYTKLIDPDESKMMQLQVQRALLVAIEDNPRVAMPLLDFVSTRLIPAEKNKVLLTVLKAWVQAEQKETPHQDVLEVFDTIIKRLAPSRQDLLRLLAGAIFHKVALPEQLLNEIRLTDEEIYSILSGKRHGHSSTVLMEAVKHGHAALESLLVRIQIVNPGKINALLQQQTSEGFSPLMLAAQHNLAAVHLLLNQIERLGDDELSVLLLQRTPEGFNALMLAARYTPQAVPGLLAKIATLDDDTRYAILSQQTHEGDNALILALKHAPATAFMFHANAFGSLLSQVHTLSDEQKERMLPEIRRALKLGVQFNPSTVVALHDSIEAFDPGITQTLVSSLKKELTCAIKTKNCEKIPALVTILLKCDVDVTFLCESLKLALDFPEGLDLLLKEISKLPVDKRSAILLNRNSKHYNLLMLAARKSFDAVTPVLTLMEGFSRDQKFLILSQEAPYFTNVLMLAIGSVTAVEALLNQIRPLTDEQKFRLFSQTDYYGFNVLEYAFFREPSPAPLLYQMIATLPKKMQGICLADSALGKNQTMELLAAIKLTQHREGADPVIRSLLKSKTLDDATLYQILVQGLAPPKLMRPYSDALLRHIETIEDNGSIIWGALRHPVDEEDIVPLRVALGLGDSSRLSLFGSSSMEKKLRACLKTPSTPKSTAEYMNEMSAHRPPGGELELPTIDPP